MITKIEGRFADKTEHSVVIETGGLHYEVFVSKQTLAEVAKKAPDEKIALVIYHYYQTDPSKSVPILIGFHQPIERDFFEKFITVSGIGPKAALRALAAPISQIAQAIDEGDRVFLKTLPGVGEQRAREIIAKLQGRVGRFALMQDGQMPASSRPASNVREEAMAVLVQLQYRREEAKQMVDRVAGKDARFESVEELLNEVYRQRRAVPAKGAA